jgi:hypothetical protein
MGLTKPRAAQIFNLDYKQSTRVVATTTVNLAGGAPNQVDGVNLSLNDRILVTSQNTPSQNGLYLVDTVGSGANGTWIRTSDGNENGEIEAGMIVMVTEGTVYADTQWKLITDDPIVIGTTALTFTQNYMANSISGGTSNVVVNSNANVTISSAGTANVLTISSTGTVTTGTASVTGNITGSNLTTSGLVSATGNVTGGNILTSGTVYVTSNVSATGNVRGGNINTAGVVTATGNVIGNNVIGSSSIQTVGFMSATGNVIGGNVIGGVVSATGNVIGGNLVTTGQANVGTLTVNGGSTFTGNLLPTANVTYNLGSPTQRWNEIFLAANTIDIGGATISADIETGSLILKGPDGAEFILTGTSPTDSFGVFGIVEAGNASPATSTTTGALRVTGGAGIGGNIYTGGIVDIAGNSIYLGNLVLKDNGSNIFGLYAADGTTPATISQSSVDTTKISNGTSNVQVVSANANVTVSVGGTANVMVVSTAGANVLGTLGVSGNITGGNLSGNLITGTLTTAAQPNVTSVGTLTSVSVTGNVTGGNVVTTGNVSATGNVAGNYLLANIYFATGFSASRIFNGTSEANIGTPSGNANISIGGVSNVVVFASTGEYVTGLLSATGNITGGNVSGTNLTGANVSVTGTVTAASTIGGVITGSSASVSGTVTAASTIGGVIAGSSASVTGNVTGGNVIASTALTNGNITITGASIVSTGPTLTIDPNGSGGTDGNVIITGNLSVQGNVTYINSNNITTNDLTINVANNASTASQANGGGIGVGPAGSEYISLTYNSSSNVWVATNGLASQGILSATGNVSGSNVLTGGLISATGNVTGGNILGNGAGLTGINSFSNVTVTGGNSAVADSIADTLTLTAGTGISITVDPTTDTITIGAQAGSEIFVDGADFGTVTEPVTLSDDLGLVIDLVDAEADLGELVLSGLIYPNQFVLPSFTTSTLPSAAVAGAMIYVTNETGGPVPAFADGTNWRRVTDRAIVT